MAKNYSKTYFQFNLIAPKTKEEVVLLVERDNTIFYSVLLIIFGMFLFFALSVIKSVFVDPALAVVNKNIETVGNQINGLTPIRQDNGELYIKSRALEPILDKDVEVTKVLELEAKLRAEFPNLIDVSDYSRRQDGAFAISFFINDATRLKDILSYLGEQPDVNNIFIDSIAWENGQRADALVDISFFISNLKA